MRLNAFLAVCRHRNSCNDIDKMAKLIANAIHILNGTENQSPPSSSLWDATNDDVSESEFQITLSTDLPINDNSTEINTNENIDKSNKPVSGVNEKQRKRDDIIVLTVACGCTLFLLLR